MTTTAAGIAELPLWQALTAFPIDPEAPHGHVGPKAPHTIYESFMAFHQKNPRVYRELVQLARRLKAKGVAQMGIGMLYEVLRYRTALRTAGDPFKLNNSYRSYYARLIMLDEPDLAGCFELRELNEPLLPSEERARVPRGTIVDNGVGNVLTVPVHQDVPSVPQAIHGDSTFDHWTEVEVL